MTSVRRTALAAAALWLPAAPLAARALDSRDVDALPASRPAAVWRYGPDPREFGELRLPAGRGPFPVVVVIHGGCWTRGFATVRNTAAMAGELTANGVATWNIEYRQVGDPGGGWPGTFLDWGAAVDALRALARSYPLDLARVVVAGHSAGAHAALWVAARRRLPAGSEIRGTDPLPVRAAVAIDGPGDLAGFAGVDAEICGRPVVAPLLGGTPAERPDRYRQASPQALLPLGVPQCLVAAAVLSPAKAREYQRLARAGGDRVEILRLDTGHFEVIAPGQGPWRDVARVILDLALRPAGP